MARVFGYGGVANTNGARSFSGKTSAVDVSQPNAPQFIQMIVVFLSALGGAVVELFK